MVAVGFVALLVCLWAVTSALSFARLGGLWPGTDDQQPLLSTTLTPSRNYSVGFSLASTYGAAAVIIEDAHDEKRTLTWVVYGDLEYQAVMARLSLDSSRHLAPPYDDMQQYFEDVPRVMERRLKKKAGLPASADVGVLATVVKRLRSQIESDLNIRVADATLTSTRLEALYQDDVEDICEYAGFKYIIPKGLFLPILWETSSAYAGYGFGLCKHWQNDTQCHIEEGKVPRMSVFAVHYTRKALTSALAVMSSALGLWDPISRRMENFELGSEAKNRYRNEDDYWRDVKGALLQRMLETPALEKPVKIILTGDMVYGDFRHVLEETIKDHMGHVPPIFSDDAIVVAAKGAAELRRRGQAAWQ